MDCLAGDGRPSCGEPIASTSVQVLELIHENRGARSGPCLVSRNFILPEYRYANAGKRI
jgi:hypothetical protein